MSGEFDNSFDIFRGTLNDSPIWVEKADGLRGAIERMTVLAHECPDNYFVSHVVRRKVIAEWREGKLSVFGKEF